MKNLSFALLFLCSIPAFAEGKLSDESQAGVVITNGNSHTQNYSVASITRYAWEKNTLELKGNYLRAVTSGELNSLNWLVSLRYERSLKDFLKGFVKIGRAHV